MRYVFVFVFLMQQFLCGVLSALSERTWLTSEYLPQLSGKILFVGVDDYNVGYWELVQTPELFETIDCLPSQARYGSPYKHHIQNFVNFDPGYQYDHICLFGVMGHPPHSKIDGYYNILTDEDNDIIIQHAHQLLKNDGTLQLGPNRIQVPEFNLLYWIAKFSSYPLNNYKVMTNSYGSHNMLYWAQKTTMD